VFGRGGEGGRWVVVVMIGGWRGAGKGGRKVSGVVSFLLIGSVGKDRS